MSGICDKPLDSLLGGSHNDKAPIGAAGNNGVAAVKQFEVYLMNPMRRVDLIRAGDLAEAIKLAKKKYGDDVFVCGKPTDATS